MARYPLGGPVRVSTTVRVAGVLTTPTAIELDVLAPDGTTATYDAPSTTGTGLYYQDIPAADLPAVGRYRFTWTTTGTGAGVVPGSFDVYAADDLSIISLEDAKQQLTMPASSTVNDDELRFMVASATSVIERLAGAVVPRTVTETVRQRGGCASLMLPTCPVLSVTSLTSIADSLSYDVSALYVDSPLAGIVRRADGGAIRGGPWTAVYRAGRVEVPPNIGLAARMLVQHLWETQRGGPPSAPRMEVGVEGVTPGVWFAVPNKVKELLEGESMPMVAF